MQIELTGLTGEMFRPTAPPLRASDAADATAIAGTNAESPPPQETDDAAIETKLNALNEELAGSSVALKFTRDENSGSVVIQLFDAKTGETLEQIPSEVSLRLSAALVKLQGRLINRKA